MNKFFSFLITILLAGYTISDAQVVFSDNFDYTSGQNLSSIGYTLVSGTSSTVSSSGLTFGNYAGSSGSDKAATFSGTSGSVSKAITVSQTSGSLYSSGLFSINANFSNTAGLALFSQQDANSRGPSVLIQKDNDSSHYRIGVRGGGSGGNYIMSVQLQPSTTYLFVLKQNLDPSLKDTSELFIFTTDQNIPSIEPTSSIVSTSFSSANEGAPSKIILYNNATGTFDGLRITRTWPEAVSILANRVASVATGAESSIGSNSATVSASLSSYGWTSGGAAGTISERGVAWNTTGSPLKSENSTVSLESDDSFNTTLSEIPAGTEIFARAYADNAAGTAYGSDISFFTLSDEPGNHSAGITAEVVTLSSVLLDWEENTGVSGYLILQKEDSAPTGVPSDATAYLIGETIGDATVAYIGSFEADTSTTITGLVPNTTYYFSVIPFNDNGSDEATTNYLTDGAIPTASVLTLLPGQSAESDIVEAAGFSYSQNIAFISSTSADITDANSVVVWSLAIRDGGEGMSDSDENSTTLTNLTLNVTNHSVLQKLALYDGTTELAEVAVEGSEVVFSGLDIVAADNSQKIIDLRATFQSVQSDNQQFSFTVSATEVDVNGSVMATGDAGSAASSETGDNNRVEVVATIINITGQPSANAEFQTGESWSPAISAQFEDANGNLDVDYTGSVSVTHSGSGLLSNATANAVAGMVSFSTLAHDTPENLSLNLDATGVGITALNSVVIVNPREQLFAEDMNSGIGATTPTNVVQWARYDNLGVLTFGNGSGSPTLTSGTLSTGAPQSSTSSAYSGSGSYFVNLTNGQGFAISSINTENYTSLRLSFGFRVSPNANFSSSNTFLEFSTDSSTWTSVDWAASINAASADDWFYAGNIALPSSASAPNLQIRWRHTVGLPASLRIDDVTLMGSPVLASEPTVAASAASVSDIGDTFMTLNWTNGNGQARLVLAKAGSAVDATPEDGMFYSADHDFGDGDQIGTGNFVVYNGTASSVVLGTLSLGTTYHFQVFEYNGSDATTNYMATGATTSATTEEVSFASLSDVVAVSNSEAESISSLVNDDAPLSFESGVAVWQFTIRDGGETGSDFDNHPTEVLSATIQQGSGNTVSDWSEVIETAALFNGSSLLATATVNVDNLDFVFSEALNVPDNGSTTLTLRLSLKSSGIPDDEVLAFEITDAGLGQDEPGSSTSRFTESFASSNAELNVIEVIATELRLADDIKPVPMDIEIADPIEVEAVDANGNPDLTLEEIADLSSPDNTFSGTSDLDAVFMNGVASFSAVTFTSQNLHTTLVVSAFGFEDLTIENVYVFPKSTPDVGDIVINQISSDYDGTGKDLVEIVNKTDNFFDLSEFNFRSEDISGNLFSSISFSGVLEPNEFFLIAEDTEVTEPLYGPIAADQQSGGFLPTEGQFAIVHINTALLGSLTDQRKGDDRPMAPLPLGAVILDGIYFGGEGVNNFGEGSPLAAHATGNGYRRIEVAGDTDDNANDFEEFQVISGIIRNSESMYFDNEVLSLSVQAPSVTISNSIVESSVIAFNELVLQNQAITINEGGSVVLQNADGSSLVDQGGWIVGELTRAAESEDTYIFPVGDSEYDFPVTVSVSSMSTEGSLLSASYIAEDAGVTGDLPLGVLEYYTGGYWVVTSDGLSGSGTFNISIESENIFDYFIGGDRTGYVLLKRADSEFPWELAGSGSVVSGTVITAENVSGLSEFAIGYYDEGSVPVELASVELIVSDNNPRLVWKTKTESGNYGFEIERSKKGKSGFGVWEKVGFVEGQGTSTTPKAYEFAIREKSVPALYRLKQIDADGSFTYLNELNFEGVAEKFGIAGNYPNPFNPETMIRITLPAEMKIKVSIINILGQEVETVVNDFYQAGVHDINFRATNLASGVYWAVLTADGQKTAIQRMMLLK